MWGMNDDEQFEKTYEVSFHIILQLTVSDLRVIQVWERRRKTQTASSRIAQVTTSRQISRVGQGVVGVECVKVVEGRVRGSECRFVDESLGVPVELRDIDRLEELEIIKITDSQVTVARV